MLAAESGVCRAAFTMWYYDAATATCKSFIYGGCGGNENRYSSEKHCLKMCKPPSSTGQLGG